VAVLGATLAGEAAMGAVRVALFAQDSGKVNGLRASKKPKPGRLLPLGKNGKFPASVVPAIAGPAGSKGDPGPLAARSQERSSIVLRGSRRTRRCAYGVCVSTAWSRGAEPLRARPLTRWLDSEDGPADRREDLLLVVDGSALVGCHVRWVVRRDDETVDVVV
jgi:hypothetical protein